MSLFLHTLQVLIQETGGRRLLGIGVVWEGYEVNHSMPGWSEGTVGYHVDDGTIFHAKNPDKGEEVEGDISRASLVTYLTSAPRHGIRTPY